MTTTTSGSSSTRPRTSGKWDGLRRNNLKRKGVNRTAIVALVTGVLLFPVPFVSIICGGAALGQIGRTNQSGKSLAIVGIALGVVGCVLWTAFWLTILFTKNANFLNQL